MKDQNPKFMMRDRNTGRFFGVHPSLEALPHMEKIPFAEAYPELCMPEHVKKAVAKKAAPQKEVAKPATAKKANAKKKVATKAKPKPGLDLSTDEADIDKDPEEILGGDLSSEIDDALGQDASRGLK